MNTVDPDKLVKGKVLWVGNLKLPGSSSPAFCDQNCPAIPSERNKAKAYQTDTPNNSGKNNGSNNSSSNSSSKIRNINSSNQGKERG